MPHIHVKWFEPENSIDNSGKIPINWVEEIEDTKIVRMPNDAEAKEYNEKCTPPNEDWHVFIFIQELSPSG